MNDFPFSPFVHFTASTALIYIQPEVFHLPRARKLKLFADISIFVVSCLNCMCFHPQVENLFKKKRQVASSQVRNITANQLMFHSSVFEHVEGPSVPAGRSPTCLQAWISPP